MSSGWRIMCPFIGSLYVETALPDAPALPYAGTHRGKAAVGAFFASLGAAVKITQFTPLNYVQEGEWVWVDGHYAGRGPDGSERTQLADGGPNCTPPGKEAVGDADPGWSSDGTTIFSSRGLASTPAGLPTSSLVRERKLYAISNVPGVAGNPGTDLSLPSEPDCVEGVPKGSPDGSHVLLFRMCDDNGAAARPGIYLTDTAGSYRSYFAGGFGPDWNPAAEP